MKPNLAPGVDMTCNMLLKLSGQGSVYIRSIVKLEDLSTQEQDSLEIQSESEKNFEDFFPKFLDASENESNVTESVVHSASELVPLTISFVELTLDGLGHSNG